jgi:SAM-dependent methyltransferase
MLRTLRERYWHLRREPHNWLPILGQDVSPALRARLKYTGELDHWRDELARLRRWWQGGPEDWWGVPPPAEAERVAAPSGLWASSAILTLAARNPFCLEELGLAPDAFAGSRVLELGCGPMVPLLQFAGCERHGIDPLIGAYAEAGWPVFDLPVTLMQGFGEKLPYPDAYFDAVLVRNALDHVDDVARTAAEMQRVLRPGGRLLAAVEYHPPTVEEPHSLDDATMRAVFAGCEMDKRRERDRAALHADLAARFALDLDALNRRAPPSGRSRYVAWHGVKR